MSLYKSVKSTNWKKQLLFCLLVFSIGIWFLSEITLEDLHTFFLPTNLNQSGEKRANTKSLCKRNCNLSSQLKLITLQIVPVNVTENRCMIVQLSTPTKTPKTDEKKRTATADTLINNKTHGYDLKKQLEPLNGTIKYLISGLGCHIPDLDPYDVSISDALNEEERPPDCGAAWNDVLVKSNVTHLYIDTDVRDKLNLTDNLKCCARPFWKPKDNNETEFRYFKTCIPFEKQLHITAVEFIRVECTVDTYLIYRDFYSFIPSHYVSNAKELTPSKNVSILILGLDALSRLNFRRQMKQMHSYLVDRMKAVEFVGYHKVGDNTFPNLVPVLAGMSVDELKKSCWPGKEVTFDNCSFVWNDFKRAGYTTGFGEDASWMGVFEYCKMGFKNKPTDIYLRPFNQIYEKELGHDKRLNANICVGPKLNIEVFLDSISKFVLRLKDKLSFGFFWENSLSHDYLNLPHYGDEIHENFLKEFFNNGIFDQSVIIFMSDHGLRWGKIRRTYQGYIEERLPMLIISCPEWFKQTFPLAWANFNTNSKQRLTTPFDLHETLTDLLDLNKIEDKNIIERNKLLKRNTMPRGISLFLDIPSERTCNHAGISDHWCICNNDVSFPLNSTCITKAANFIVDQINLLLKDYKQCSQLYLSSIVSARYKYFTPPTNDQTPKPEEKTRIYTVMLEAYPGEGLFEGTVQHSFGTDEFHLMGSISRSNTYGNTSYCISNCELKLYCYCVVQLKS